VGACTQSCIAILPAPHHPGRVHCLPELVCAHMQSLFHAIGGKKKKKKRTQDCVFGVLFDAQDRLVLHIHRRAH
jgi:hypothetical protein